MEHQGTVVTEMAGPATVPAVLQDLPSTFPVSLVYLLKLLLDEQKQEQNKYPSPVLSIVAASSSPRLWGHFSLGPAPLSSHLTSAEVQGPAPLPRNAAGVPGHSWSQASYRAEALELVSSDALLLTWGQSSRKGDRFRGSGGGTVRAQGYALLDAPQHSHHLGPLMPIEKTAHQKSWTGILGTSVCV